ncbi:MAG: ribonuclease HII [Parcubacteria group bacterium]|nr:ribonuclease HII [Parcubacteria group bacterium]
MKYGTKIKYIVGVDEVGRGPFAGPVTLGVCVVPIGFNKKFFRGLRDSKKLSPEKRQEWFKKINQEKKSKKLRYSVFSVRASVIDKRGLSFAINFALNKALLLLKLKPNQCFIFLDGGLRAPKEFIFQKTVIKGDEKIPVISLASIVAKVTRDRKMVLFAKRYPKYGFEIHKGYGTLAHRRAIKKYSSCQIHRKSFLKKLDNS